MRKESDRNDSLKELINQESGPAEGKLQKAALRSRAPRLMFAAPKSGGGKTTLTCAFLQTLKNRGLFPAAFKCGPDYIDPMFHSRVIGVPSRNLDLFFTEEETVRGLFCRHTKEADIAVLEGVMGYYDGLGGDSDLASAWHLASALAAPAVLVLDPKGASLSLVPLVQGFLAFRSESRIRGLILNRCTSGLYAALKPMLERETGLKALGYLPEMPDCSFESRHLGLVTADEISGLRQKIRKLAAQLEETVDVAALLSLARSAPEIIGSLPEVKSGTPAGPVSAGTGRETIHDKGPDGKEPAVTFAGIPSRPRIAVAKDQAFCFYYQDNLELLEELGAELCNFSPLTDEALPAGTSALYLGGGYPELQAEKLSANKKLLAAIRQAASRGLPILAECGGFQYLQERLMDERGRLWTMAGILSGESRPAGRLVRFGYLELTARRDNLLCRAGEKIRAHEFHYWDSEENGETFQAEKPGKGRGWPCIQTAGRIFAGYPHLYFYSNPAFAAGFVKAAAEFRREQTAGSPGPGEPPEKREVSHQDGVSLQVGESSQDGASAQALALSQTGVSPQTLASSQTPSSARSGRTSQAPRPATGEEKRP